MVRPSGLASGLWSLFGMAVPFAIYLLVTPLLVRRLGAAQYGLLMLFVALPTALASLDLGFIAGGIFWVGRMIRTGDMERAVRLHRELLMVFFLLGGCLAASVWAAAPPAADWLGLSAAVGRDQAVLTLRLGAACLFVGFLAEAASIAMRALEQFPGLSMIQVVSKAACWTGAAVLAFSGFNVPALAGWWAGVGVCVPAAYLVWSRRLFSSWPAPAWEFQETRAILPFCFFAFIAQMTSAVAYHADKFIISHFLGPASVAYYAVAAGIAAKILTLGGVLMYFVFPRTVALHAVSDREGVRNLYLGASRLSLLVLVPVIVPLFALAPLLLRLWLGADFEHQASRVLRLLILAYFITTLSVVPSYVYSGMGNPRVGAAYAAVGAAVNAGACLVLTPLLGIAGAALSVLLGALQSVIFMGSIENSLGLGWFKSRRKLFLNLATASALQLAFLTLIRGWLSGWTALVSAGLACWFLFYAVWFLTPAFAFATDGDRDIVARLLRREWLGRGSTA